MPGGFYIEGRIKGQDNQVLTIIHNKIISLYQDVANLQSVVNEINSDLAAVVSHVNFWRTQMSEIVDYTTNPLVADDTFTGISFATAGWSRIIGSCFANVAGTLRIEQRNDGVNWDVRSEEAYAAERLLGFTIETVGNEARLVFINGPADQTAFRLFGRLRRI